MEQDTIADIQDTLQALRDGRVKPLLERLDDRDDLLQQGQQYDEAQEIKKQLTSLDDTIFELIELLDDVDGADGRIEHLRDRVDELIEAASAQADRDNGGEDVTERLGRFLDHQENS